MISLAKRMLLPLGWLLVAAITAPNLMAATGVPTQIPGRDAILLGTDWYPEQWPESGWEEDLRLMEAAGIKVVRVAEFAWSRLEPSEGKFDFDWLERAISLAAKHHIITVLGTPTATPPAWLTQAHPEILRVEENGRRVTHGNRAHASVTLPLYREYCRKISGHMGLRFGQNPDVAGWQIDNEYGYALMSHDEFTHRFFQDWIKNRYKTLNALNTAWATEYWSQTYSAWDQIPIPVGPHNPGLMLDWKRFVTQAWTDFQGDQITELRKHVASRQFITGNFMGFFDGLDSYRIGQELSFVSWDSYVGTGHLDPDFQGMAHDLTRGFKRSNFWVIETQPGAVNWAGTNNFLNRGEVRAMAWQAIAHGSDEVGYWQWRSALGGQEQYHGTLVGADGTPVPVYEEVRQIGREFSATQEAFRGTSVVSEVALLQDYDSRWALQFQKHAEKYDVVSVLKSYYRPLRRLAQSVDIVDPTASLASYKLVVAPSLNVMPKEVADHLLEYVRNGGHLVLGPRSGMKDASNGLLPQRQPGFLLDALGARVEQYYALEKEISVSGDWDSGQASIWAEQLKVIAPDAQVLMRYGKSNGWLDGQPAVLTRKHGKGRITYIGALLDDLLMARSAQWMVKESGVKPVFGPVPEGVEVSRRLGEGKQVYVLINHTPEERRVVLPRTLRLLLQKKQEAEVTLPPYGVEVLVDLK